MSDNDATSRPSECIAGSARHARRRAVRETDWDEIAVVRIIERQPQRRHVREKSGPYVKNIAIEDPKWEIKRYRERAPPISEHADGTRRCVVLTVTKPLLDTVYDMDPELFECYF